jgi:hypothetical protein
VRCLSLFLAILCACAGHAPPAQPVAPALLPVRAASATSRIQYAARTQGRSPDLNDHYFSIDEDHSTFFVADGIRESATDPDPAQSAATSFQQAPCADLDGYMAFACRLGAANAALYRSGSVAAVVAAVVGDGRIQVDLAGDMRAYLWRAGKVTALFSADGAADGAGGLGTAAAATFRHFAQDVAVGDQIVLAAGVPDTVRPDDIAAVLARPAAGVEARVDALLARLNAPGTDTTVLLLAFPGPRPDRP